MIQANRERVRNSDEVPTRVSVVVGRCAWALEASLLRQAPRRLATEGRSDGVTCDDENCSTR